MQKPISGLRRFMKFSERDNQVPDYYVLEALSGLALHSLSENHVNS